MEFHLPEGPIRSLKDFLTHLSIVTLGILIALGLEQLVTAHHRATLAAQAVTSFRRELTEDRDNVREVIGQIPELHAQIRQLITQLSAAQPAAGAASATIEYPGVHFDPISSASWDTAVATQALNEISYQNAQRFMKSYDLMRLFLDEERTALKTWQDMHAFGSDSAVLTADQRRALIEELHRYDTSAFALDLVGKESVESVDEALR
jgi:predicted RNA-binding Zn ribbon-like protein